MSSMINRHSDTAATCEAVFSLYSRILGVCYLSISLCIHTILGSYFEVIVIMQPRRRELFQDQRLAYVTPHIAGQTHPQIQEIFRQNGADVSIRQIFKAINHFHVPARLRLLDISYPSYQSAEARYAWTRASRKDQDRDQNQPSLACNLSSIYYDSKSIMWW